MKLKLIEPLRELFKDEVRRVGEALGCPREVVWRQPFPGPAWASGDGRHRREEARESAQRRRVLHEEMMRSGYYYKVWQSFCVFLPVQTVGVFGDERTTTMSSQSGWWKALTR
jgi:GMP synthase (glutamine-hydrolysing)